MIRAHSIKLLFFFLFSFITYASAHAQILKSINPFKREDNADKQPEINQQALSQLRSDVSYLASDKLEGRKMGTRGALETVNYLERRFQQIGLAFYGSTYRRSFKFISGKEMSPETKMYINDKPVLVPYEAFPFAFSAATPTAEKFILPESEEPDNYWVIPLYQNAREANDPAFNWEKTAYNMATEALARGAEGVILYDSYGSAHSPKLTTQTNYKTLDIPVWWLGKKAYDEHLKGLKTIRPLKINTSFREIYNDGINLFGYIDNHAAQTVIIMANYDGLGMDNGRPVPGANNNASGVAALLDIAAQIRSSNLKKYNYVFAALTGGNNDHIGARLFVDAKNFDASKIAYAIDLERVGRLSSTKSLTIGGTGSAAWKPVLNKLSNNNNFKWNYENAGSLKGDYMNVYEKKIPYLYFFTGYNDDDNTPNDIATKINYTGLYKISGYVFSLLQQMENEAAPKYRQVTEAESVVSGNATNVNNEIKNPVAKVSLGIIPDADSKDGVKVVSVTKGRAADNAGIKANDIIIQMGIYPIRDISNYDDALTKFEPGKRALVKVKRNDRMLNFTITFQ